MSFIKDEAAESKFVSKNDLLTLLVLGVLFAGGYFYYKNAKETAKERVTAAEEVFVSGDYIKATLAFEELNDLAWKSDSLDSLIYERMSFLADLKEGQIILLEEGLRLHKKKDTTGVLRVLEQYKDDTFLDEDQKTKMNELKALYVTPLVTIQDTVASK